MKITSPVPGYSGYVRVGSYSATFLAGSATDKAANIPSKARTALEEAGYTFEDDRPGRQADPAPVALPAEAAAPEAPSEPAPESTPEPAPDATPDTPAADAATAAEAPAPPTE